MLEARTREADEAIALAQQLAQDLADLAARETERGLVLTLGDVLFDDNRASLKPGAQQHLYRLVTSLKEHPEQTVMIEGHTDSRGSDSYNLDLSERRARAVLDFLISNGIGPERITSKGLGESYPLASNDTAAGRQQNRRVEIVLPRAGQTVSSRRSRVLRCSSSDIMPGRCERQERGRHPDGTCGADSPLESPMLKYPPQAAGY